MCLSPTAHRLALLLLLAATCAAGCSTLDVTQPISLDPDPSWLEGEVQDLAAAAECWNLHFGTHLQVNGDKEVWQRVSVSYNDFICLYAAGRTEPTFPVSVRVCPYRVQYSPLALFDVLLHELGHVLNIRGHASTPHAVMQQGSALPRNFTEEDAKLFREANPDADLQPSCSVLVDEGTCHCY